LSILAGSEVGETGEDVDGGIGVVLSMLGNGEWGESEKKLAATGLGKA